MSMITYYPMYHTNHKSRPGSLETSRTHASFHMLQSKLSHVHLLGNANRLVLCLNNSTWQTEQPSRFYAESHDLKKKKRIIVSRLLGKQSFNSPCHTELGLICRQILQNELLRNSSPKPN